MTDDQLPMELIELDVAPAPILLAQVELQNAAYESAALLVLDTKVTGPADQVEMVRQLLLALAAEIRSLKGTEPKLETRPAAFEVLDHVHGTYVTRSEEAARKTEFPYNGLYRRQGAIPP